MLRRYLEQRHIDLDSGRSCLALEREYWQALEVLAYEDGWNNWRDFFLYAGTTRQAHRHIFSQSCAEDGDYLSFC